MEATSLHSAPVARRAASTPADRRRTGERLSLVGVIGYALHGVVFIGLAIGAVVYFGSIFGLVGSMVAMIGLASLKQAWTGFHDYHGH